jgi:hypothetical protein
VCHVSGHLPVVKYTTDTQADVFCISYDVLYTFILCRLIYNIYQGCTNFPKSRNHLKILVTRRVTYCKFHTGDSQAFGASVQNLVVGATWCPRRGHSSSRPSSSLAFRAALA